jgi:LysM repeat protein
MKKSWVVVGIVVGVHVVAIGSAILIQGCRSTGPGGGARTEPAVVMPPISQDRQVPLEPEVKTPLEPRTSSTLAPEPPAKKWSAETTTHVVAPGESLSTIAYKYKLNANEIAALNKIKDPRKLRVGQKLILPGKVKAVRAFTPKKTTPKVASEAAEKASTTEAAAGDGAYVVKSGDSLSKIASAHGTTTKALKDANKLTSDRIRIGQKLAMPGAGKAAPAVQPPALDLATPKGTGAEPVAGAAVEPVTPTAPAGEGGGTTTTPVTGGMRNYTVEEDGDLYTIGMMWGVSVNKLKEVNGLTGTTVRAGQVLKIPLSE